MLSYVNYSVPISLTKTLYSVIGEPLSEGKVHSILRLSPSNEATKLIGISEI